MRQSGKQDSFRHKLKSSVSMYESPGLQFLGTTTGIQSGPDIFDEWRFIMIFLTILRVAEILCFRLVPEDKIDKGILESSILQFFEKFLANNFPLSDSEDNTSRLLNRGGIADFPFLENTISNSPKVSRTKFLGSDGIFCFISVCKFGSFKNPFATITILSEIYFRFRRFTLLEQIILWAIAATQAAENHGNEWGLTWHSRWGIYINFNMNLLAEFSSSSRSTQFNDDHEDRPNQHENSHKLYNKTGLCVIIMSRARFRANLHSIAAWMSRNS